MQNDGKGNILFSSLCMLIIKILAVSKVSQTEKLE